MIADLLQNAGFPGVESEAGVTWARLSPAGPEFRADPAGQAAILTLLWPVRLDAAVIAAWNAAHPGAILDLAGGEARLRLGVETAADLAEWPALAEAMIATCLAFRRDQRARGEGF